MNKIKMENCLFCEWLNKKKDFVHKNNSFYSFFDENPVSGGHALVIPKKHIVSFFDLDDKEMADLLEAVKNVKKVIDKKYKPDGYNIGVNEGEVAGRTINHLHVHVIPRYKGDVINPIGGVRNIIPEKGDYTKNKESNSLLNPKNNGER
jgi:diadenosine tetraphosphate (Ap4A) HIT family hydrolase